MSAAINVQAASESVREAITPEFVAKIHALVDAQLKGMVPSHLIPSARNQALGEILATSFADQIETVALASNRLIALQFAVAGSAIGFRNQLVAKFDGEGNRKKDGP